jgi:hypothetical protein
MATKNRRNQIIVNKTLQTKIILSTSVPMFALLGVATLLEYLYFVGVQSGRIQSDGTIFGMPEHRLGMLLIFVFGSTYQLASALLTSHKIAGASYRIAETLHQFREGDQDVRASLRKGDYQVELADEINGFLDWARATPPSAMPSPSGSARVERPAAKSPNTQRV